jgi:hypothetical protein
VTNRLIDVFPPDNNVALCVVALCAAATDVNETDRAAREANPPDAANDPHHTHRARLTYHVRRTLGHLFEGIAALKAWRADEDVRALLWQLSPGGQQRLDLVCRLERKIGDEPLKSVRHATSHYARPGTRHDPDPVAEYADAIRKNPDVETGFDRIVAEVPPGQNGPPPRRLYRFADQVQTSVAFGGFDPDEETAKKELSAVQEAADAFVELVDEVFDLYCDQRGIRSSWGDTA